MYKPKMGKGHRPLDFSLNMQREQQGKHLVKRYAHTVVAPWSAHPMKQDHLSASWEHTVVMPENRRGRQHRRY